MEKTCVKIIPRRSAEKKTQKSPRGEQILDIKVFFNIQWNGIKTPGACAAGYRFWLHRERQEGFIMANKRIFLRCIAVIIATVILSAAAAVSAIRFEDDGTIGVQYIEAVMGMAERNVINGFPDGLFRPENSAGQTSTLS